MDPLARARIDINLDAIEAALKEHPVEDSRHRIEHCTHCARAARQMNERVSVLNSLAGAKGLGNEGWFRIEIYHVLKLNGINVHIRNKGPDLDFDDFSLELKAAQISPAGWVRTQGLKYPGVDCLFLGPSELIESLNPDYYRPIYDNWIVGLLTNEEVNEDEEISP